MAFELEDLENFASRYPPFDSNMKARWLVIGGVAAKLLLEAERIEGVTFQDKEPQTDPFRHKDLDIFCLAPATFPELVQLPHEIFGVTDFGPLERLDYRNTITWSSHSHDFFIEVLSEKMFGENGFESSDAVLLKMEQNWYPVLSPEQLIVSYLFHPFGLREEDLLTIQSLKERFSLRMSIIERRVRSGCFKFLSRRAMRSLINDPNPALWRGLVAKEVARRSRCQLPLGSEIYTNPFSSLGLGGLLRFTQKDLLAEVEIPLFRCFCEGILAYYNKKSGCSIPLTSEHLLIVYKVVTMVFGATSWWRGALASARETYSKSGKQNDSELFILPMLFELVSDIRRDHGMRKLTELSAQLMRVRRLFSRLEIAAAWDTMSVVLFTHALTTDYWHVFTATLDQMLSRLEKNQMTTIEILDQELNSFFLKVGVASLLNRSPT